MVHSGAVAGFPLPALRYFVGSGQDASLANRLSLLLPVENAVRSPESPIDFSWSEIERAAFYRLEVVDDYARPVVGAILLAGIGTYRAPSWFKEKVANGSVRWRVVALDQTGTQVGETAWRNLKLASDK